MSYVTTERHGQTLTIRLNRPERLNALGSEMRSQLAAAFTAFHEDADLEVAILTGSGRAFCAGEDMKESLERGSAGVEDWGRSDPFMDGRLRKPVIGAVNGFAMGGGFLLLEQTDLRVAVRGAVIEVSEAKRWLLGGYNHGHLAGLPHAVATEMALGFRFTAERLYEVGFLNRLVDPETLMSEAMAMADHLLSLPPASRVNTLQIMRDMRPKVPSDIEQLAKALRNHGDKSDLMESRQAFAEKRAPRFKGWVDAGDRERTPTLASIRAASEDQPGS